MLLTLKIDQLTYLGLKQNSYKAKEKVVANALMKLYYDRQPKIGFYTDAYGQYNYGDLCLIMDNSQPLNIEIKSSNTFQDKDYQIADWLYFKNEGLTIPYKQENTNHNIGWLQTCKSNVLASLNLTSMKLYIIYYFPTFKNNIVQLINSYFNEHDIRTINKLGTTIDYNIRIKYRKDEGIKTKDKYTVEICIPFDIDCINVLGGKLKTYDIEFYFVD